MTQIRFVQEKIRFDYKHEQTVSCLEPEEMLNTIQMIDENKSNEMN